MAALAVVTPKYQPRVDWAELSQELEAVRIQGDRIELAQIEQVFRAADYRSNPEPLPNSAPAPSEFRTWFKPKK